jgi:hypothetical protein
MKKTIATIAAGMLLLPAAALAQGLIGQCADCHTMHNSEQNKPVAQKWDVATKTVKTGQSANQNLLKMDCIACHASGTSSASVKPMLGGSKIPQVYHLDTANDLAGGNFKYVIESGDRKGHNITDLVAQDVSNKYAAPGDIRTHNFGPGYGRLPVSGASDTTKVTNTGFTCAGAVGCHGTRAQLISGYTDLNGGDGSAWPSFWANTQKRQGIAAISGAHHNNYDGLKEPLQNAVAVHDGSKVADGYRFIQGLIGQGNMTAGERWMNKNASSHNEYFGLVAGAGTDGTGGAEPNGCNRCHIEGTSANGGSGRMTYDSTLRVPNQSMTGFCITCHGNFHSTASGAATSASIGDFQNNGTSGAFLRHPSDYALPERGEYLGYTTYNVSAPVARPSLDGSISATVTAGTDMVMCLSCHQAHATPFDGMLRFNYAQMIAGGGGALGEGCLACHTTKGVSKQ